MKKKYGILLILLFTLILSDGEDINTSSSGRDSGNTETVKPKEKNDKIDKEVKDVLDKAVKDVQRENQTKTDQGTGQPTDTNTQDTGTISTNPENIGTDSVGTTPTGVSETETGITPTDINTQTERRTNIVPMKIDPKKPVKQAIDKEEEVPTIYKGDVLKYIATADGYEIKSHGANVVHPMASLTKIMNILVTLDEVDKGNKSLDDKLCFDQTNANIGGSWLNVKVGECYTLRDLLRAQNIYSANNSSYIVAKHVGNGSIDKFIELMNEKAKSLGMKNTKFYTPAGLPTSMTGKQLDVSTAEDLYLMAKAALKDPRIREWAAEKELVLLNGIGEQIVYPSRNHVLGKNGIWGLKTGFHNLSGYNIIVTSQQGNLEIITIILGEVTDHTRTNTVLSEYKDIESKMVKTKTAGTIAGEFKIKDGKKKVIEGVLASDVYEIKDDPYNYEIKDLNEKAAITKGSVIGKLIIKKGDLEVSEINIISNEDVAELSGFGKFLRWITFGLI